MEEALEAAKNLSRNDELLWSLGVVMNTHRPGLAWISGTNYDGIATSPQEWRQRWQMEARYLIAKSVLGKPPVMPSGLRHIRMFPEWMVRLPLWGFLPDPHPYEPGMLQISASLEQELIEWNQEWESYGLDGERPDSWKDRGWELYEQLRSALNGFAEVHPGFDDRD